MQILLQRVKKHETYTPGYLSILESAYIFCYTLEDAIREEKIAHETCFSPGVFPVEIRRGSPTSNRYDKAYEDIEHDGMLWIREIPGYRYVYLHTGYDIDDTAGCPLVGHKRQGNKILSSRDAYREIYPVIWEAANASNCTIHVRNP